MALAGSIERFSMSSWNPLRVTDTDLPPQLLLMAKLLILGLILKDYHLGFPDVFAPFFEWMEIFPAPWYRRAFKLAFIVCGTALLFNRTVRVNCVVLGGLFLVATLSSKVYYRNAKVFVGVLLFLTGLQEKGKPPWMIWWQLAIMYFGAGLNKLLEVDWRTGQYFDYFLTHIYPSDAYRLIAPLLPGQWVARLMGWSIILAELSAAVMFTMNRLRPMAVWVAASVHVGAALLVVGDYGIFMAAILASYLSCLPWPERLDAAAGTRGGWDWVRRFFGTLDQDRLIHWADQPPKDGAGLTLTGWDWCWSGWKALGGLLIWTPAIYFVAVAVLTGFDGNGRVVVVRLAGTVGAVILLGIAVAKLRAFVRALSNRQAIAP
jgi:hypothetical protein